MSYDRFGDPRKIKTVELVSELLDSVEDPAYEFDVDRAVEILRELLRRAQLGEAQRSLKN